MENPFFEPFMLLPALQHFADAGVGLLTAWLGPRLVGLHPVAPWRVAGRTVGLRTWLHPHAYLGAPLVASDVAACAYRLLATGLVERSPTGWAELPVAPLDEGRTDDFETAVRAAGHSVWRRTAYTRAAYRQGDSAVASRRADRKQRAASARLGHTLSLQTEPTASAAQIAAFHALEIASWKGRAGTAMAQSPRDAAWLEAVIRGAAAEGRLVMQSLVAHDKALVVNVNFRAGRSIFALKTAFDEQVADLSPGYLAERLTVEWLQGQPDVDLLDTCAAPDQAMVSRVYASRRSLGTLWLGPATASARLVATALPRALWAWRTLARRTERDETAKGA